MIILPGLPGGQDWRDSFETDPVLLKFLHHEHLRFWTESETVRIASNLFFRAEYAKMEVPNVAINDPSEGKSILVQQRPVRDWNAASENERRVISEALFGGNTQVAPGVKIDISNNIIERHVLPFFMLCFSHGPLEELASYFCGPNADIGMQPYDACIRIPSARVLCQLIFERGTAVLLDGEIHLSKLMRGFQAGPVRYRDIVQSWENATAGPGAFFKDRTFSRQREFRLAFRPARGLPDPVSVHVPGLRELVEIVDLSNAF